MKSQYLRENLRELPFWNPTRIPADEHGRAMHRMDLNECGYPPSPKVLEAIRIAAEGLNRYPDGTCPELSARLAERTGVPVANICYGSGSTQLLTSIIETAVEPGGGLVSPSIVWRRFQGIYRALAANVTECPVHADGRIDVEAMIGAIGNDTRIVVCVTPNNPTGLMLDHDEVAYVVAHTPENVLLYVDEAYHEFAVHAGGPDVLALLAERKGPWAVTRTFSKAYALAGMRLGYALCSSQEMANAVRLLTSTFNIPGIAEAAALAALDDPDYTRFIIERNAEERERIVAGFERLGCKPLPSVTNFVSADIGTDSAPVVKLMRERGVRVATWGYEASGSYIRASTGFPEDTDALLAALGTVLAEVRQPPA